MMKTLYMKNFVNIFLSITRIVKRIFGEDGAEIGDIIEDTSAKKPEAGLVSDERTARIREAVAALPDTQKEVFLLRTEQDLSFAEIAEMLKIPLNTALGRMHYAVTRLRKELADI